MIEPIGAINARKIMGLPPGMRRWSGLSDCSDFMRKLCPFFPIMRMHQFRPLLVVAIVGALVWSMVVSESAAQQGPGGGGLVSLEHDLEITQPSAGTTERLDLGEALRRLNIPSVSIALIEGDKLIWAGAYGNASTRTLYQAASLSKLVAAVAALRLVRQGRLGLDRDVNAGLVSWHVLESNLTREHP